MLTQMILAAMLLPPACARSAPPQAGKTVDPRTFFKLLVEAVDKRFVPYRGKLVLKESGRAIHRGTLRPKDAASNCQWIQKPNREVQYACVSRFDLTEEERNAASQEPPVRSCEECETRYKELTRLMREELGAAWSFQEARKPRVRRLLAARSAAVIAVGLQYFEEKTVPRCQVIVYGTIK